jgi:hypothetical protein
LFSSLSRIASDQDLGLRSLGLNQGEEELDFLCRTTRDEGKVRRVDVGAMLPGLEVVQKDRNVAWKEYMSVGLLRGGGEGLEVLTC